MSELSRSTSRPRIRPRSPAASAQRNSHHLLNSVSRWWGGRAVEGWGSAYGIRGRRARWHPPTRPAAIHSRLGRRERARAGNRGSASNARQSRALKNRGLAASLAEPRLENCQTRQPLCVFRTAFHLLNSTFRWWGGRAVEGWGSAYGIRGRRARWHPDPLRPLRLAVSLRIRLRLDSLCLGRQRTLWPRSFLGRTPS